MWTKAFWKAAAERAIKTAAQTMLSVWLVGDVALDIFAVDFGQALGVGLGGAVVSLLTSVASAQIGDHPGPSLAGEKLSDAT